MHELPLEGSKQSKLKKWFSAVADGREDKKDHSYRQCVHLSNQKNA
jgi:hypothetical protein